VSTLEQKAKAPRDGDGRSYSGKGVRKTAPNVRATIAEEIAAIDAVDRRLIDKTSGQAHFYGSGRSGMTLLAIDQRKCAEAGLFPLSPARGRGVFIRRHPKSQDHCPDRSCIALPKRGQLHGL